MFGRGEEEGENCFFFFLRKRLTRHEVKLQVFPNFFFFLSFLFNEECDFLMRIFVYSYRIFLKMDKILSVSNFSSFYIRF